MAFGRSYWGDLLDTRGVIRVALAAAAMVAAAATQDAGSAAVRFHHLHLTGGVEFYARLFDRAATRRDTLAGFDALRSGPMLMLFGVPPDRPSVPERQSAIWHFGWGDVSSGETYLRHAAREVEWEPPLPAAKLHLHLLSTSPAATAAWYRDRLHADVEVVAGTVKRQVEARPELRPAEALVRLGEFAMLIYRTDETLVSTRGQRADHVALRCADLDGTLARLRASGVVVLSSPRPFASGRAAMIEGPDLIAIELVEGVQD